ncbi:Tyrosine-protein kinase ephrin type A/B receptor-like protein [Gracilaria domingensis]|nr:Tyrosine-protein kinase ephrin type A/B receptor-like protein [Gracilaria domingensis]
MFSGRGSSSCTPCPEGLFSTKRSPLCVASCPKGTHILTTSPSSNENGCSPCNGGYGDEENLFKCKRCPPGSAAPLGAISIDQCTPCPAGTDSAGDSPCVQCGPYMFSTASSAKCTLCPPGSTAETFLGSTTCIPCQPGQYVVEDSVDESMDHVHAATSKLQLETVSDAKPMKCMTENRNDAYHALLAKAV